MPVWQRLEQVDDLNTLADAFALADLRRKHPGATPTQLEQLLAARRNGTPASPGASRDLDQGAR